MKQILIVMIFLACGFSEAGQPGARAVLFDGTNFFITLSGSTNPVPIALASGLGLLYTNTVPLQKIKAENCIEDKAQAFTAAAGFEALTNFVTYGAVGITGTHSNLTTSVAGWYFVSMSASWSSSANSLIMDGHLHTNLVEVTRIGWSRGFGTAAAGQQGSAAGNGLIYIPAGVNCQYNIDTDKNTTATFDHCSFVMIFLNE